MPPAAGLSRYLVNGLVPLCIWGMLSALILHLIEVRSLFIRGGEERLRLAVLAFSLGVILSQRLAAGQGRETALGYRVALAGAMALFTLYHAFAYRIPVHPLIVAMTNGVIFAALWWVGTRITEACSVDSEEGAAAAVETGILARSRHIRREMDTERPGHANVSEGHSMRVDSGLLSSAEAEKLWKERLPARHPGRILFYFSLVAVPAFGLGMYLFGSDRSAAIVLGAHLFLYLWCALSLLFLSSYNLLAAYFDKRRVTLPEIVGMTWLAIGFSVVCVVVPLAFLLPQPPSPAGDFVRERLVATYRGWVSEHGWKEDLGRSGPDDRSRDVVHEGGGERGGAQAGSGGQGRSAAEQRAARQLDHESGVDKTYVVKDMGEGRVEAAREEVRKFFDFCLKAILMIGGGAAAVALVVVLYVIGTGLLAQLSTARPLLRRPARRPKEKKDKRPVPETRATFSAYANPFSAGADFDDEHLVRHLWQATLAWCEEAGCPCGPDQTPFEFLDSSPEALRGLEAPARRLAHWLMHVEFSRQPLPTRAFKELHDYWVKLQEHARKG